MKNINPQELISLYNQNKSAYKVAKILNLNYKTVYRKLKDLGIETTSGNGNKKHHFNEDYFEIINTSEKAYWLGFIMADGCVYKGQDKYSYRLQINLQSSDEEHLKKFQSAIGSDYKIQIKLSGKNLMAYLKINSTKMCKDLIALGVKERKSTKEVFPEMKEEYYNHFIRGYFDGDGYIGFVKHSDRLSFEILGSINAITTIHDRLPVKSYLYQKRDDMLVVAVNRQSDLVLLREWLYKDADIYLDRKKSLFDKCKVPCKSNLTE